VTALSSTFCSVRYKVARADSTWASAWRVRFAVWKPLNSVCVMVAPAENGAL
jgi:hypothetical protein